MLDYIQMARLEYALGELEYKTTNDTEKVIRHFRTALQHLEKGGFDLSISTVQCRGRTMACGAAADGTVLGIHSTCAHAGLLAVRGHGNAGVPPIRTVVVASVSGGISKWWHHPAWPANARNPSPPKGKTGSRNVCSLSQRSDRSVISGRSVAHVGASGRSGCRRFRLVGHHSFGGQEQACDGGCVLQGGTGDLDRVGDAGGQ